MIILVINCGSSSIKYQLLDMKNDDVYDVLAKGLVEKIGLETGCLQHTATGKDKYVIDLPIPDHKVGMKLVLDALTDADHGVLKSLDDIEAVGHRIVHGGEYFSSSALVNEDVMKKIEICCDFAPLHNPAHLLGIRAVQAVLPSVPQVVTFDTAFHQSIPPYAFMYGLPYEDYSKYRVRKYGAHGTSHQFVAEKGAKFAGLDVNNSRIITCHLGNGSSITAVLNGKSIDTSMGFTPLDGVVMGTRCGSIDPNIIPYLMKKDNLTPDQMTEIMNKKSGFLGISGVSSDARDLDARANAGDMRCKLALKMLTYGVIKYIGQFAAVMNGVDLIVFTGGIGEHNSRLRRRVCENFSYLGLKFDYEANTAFGEDAMLSLPDSKVKVALITTDEEIVIARDTMHIVMSEEEN
ncbi:MAG: acetate kinase [Candidatus Cryptobacteroides sp.]|nr:acetate kinase [Bacteroidales bacterium]MDY2860329.1 acetate kinase [Candidatus Cryptobacteroides sp.]MCI7634603.1 acetate kinase [Bacteroidales bacterium]MDD7082445.1 acetate kinase [Bacteroidales bacterium]MDD7118247.1 acetate kinase [Bacteroidales bacterium]